MKILRKLCSEQVQILLERMDNHWAEEFAIESSKWEPMLPHGRAFEQFTRVEQRCIRKTAQEQTTKLKKERAYSGILERTMSPAKTRWEFNEERHVGVMAQEVARPGQILTASALANQAQNMLQQEYDTAYKHAQYAEADRLRQYMQNVQFELRNARSQADLEIAKKNFEFLLKHEKASIEHQQYLKQHAPRGYL